MAHFSLAGAPASPLPRPRCSDRADGNLLWRQPIFLCPMQPALGPLGRSPVDHERSSSRHSAISCGDEAWASIRIHDFGLDVLMVGASESHSSKFFRPNGNRPCGRIPTSTASLRQVLRVDSPRLQGRGWGGFYKTIGSAQPSQLGGSLSF